MYYFCLDLEIYLIFLQDTDRHGLQTETPTQTAKETPKTLLHVCVTDILKGNRFIKTERGTYIDVTSVQVKRENIEKVHTNYFT